MNKVLILLLVDHLLSAVLASLKTELSYAVSLLPPVTGKYFSGTVTKDQLLCFGNLDYHEDTYLESFLCLLQWSYDSELSSQSCFALWGTRSVVVEVDGSIEFVRLKKLPRESGEDDKRRLVAEHWLFLSNAFENKPARETVRVDAEPIYICARSNMWGEINETSSFNLQFRKAYVRSSDRKNVLKQLLLQSLFAFGTSLPLVSPILGSITVGNAFYIHGLKYFIVISISCALFLLSAPVILTRKSRRTTRAAFQLLHISTDEVEDITHRVWLLYQSFYLSSLIVCLGSVSAYLLFSVLGIERELRNNMIRVCLGIAGASFSYFFITKLFPHFSRQYLWIVISFYTIFTTIKDNINKRSQEEVLLAMYFILAVSNILYRKVSGFTFIARVRRDCVNAMGSLIGFSIVPRLECDVDIKESAFTKLILDSVSFENTAAVPRALFLKSADTNALNLLSEIASYLTKIHTRKVDTSKDFRGEMLQHEIIYEFSANEIAVSNLNKIAMVSEEFSSIRKKCHSCNNAHFPQFLSIKVSLKNIKSISLCLRQRAKVLSPNTCTSCLGRKSPSVYDLIDHIKQQLSVQPCDILMEKCPTGADSTCGERLLSVLNSSLTKSSIDSLGLQLADMENFTSEKLWQKPVEKLIRNFHQALHFPSGWPLPRVDISMSSDNNVRRLCLSAHVEFIKLNSLSDAEKDAVWNALRTYDILFTRDEIYQLPHFEDWCAESLGVASIILSLMTFMEHTKKEL